MATPEEIAALKAEQDRLDYEWKRLMIGFMSSVEDITYDTVKDACGAYIQASYKFQKAKWGKVQVRMSAASLMREGI